MYLPSAVQDIMVRFRERDASIYVVGGAVRDFVMGKEPHDYDLTTPLLPEEILNLFHDYTTFREGEKFGTIGVMTSEGPVEITTFRIDGDYEDGRKPKGVSFTPNLIDDLKRRDFTVTAIAYSPQDGIVDPFDGIGD